jgi:hypothetical protein
VREPPRSAGFEGVVVDRFGEPVTSFELVAIPFDKGLEERLAQSFSSPDGRFRWDLPRRKWLAIARADAGHSMPVELDVANDATARFVLEEYAAVTGIVVGDRAPIGGADVVLEREWPKGDTYADETQRTITDGAGWFRFDRVASGIVAVVAAADGHADRRQSQVEVEAGETRHVELVLFQAGRLVVELDPSIGTGEGQSLRLEPYSGVSSSLPLRGGRTDGRGVCVFERVAEGDYRIVALGLGVEGSGNEPGYSPAWVGARVAAGRETRVTLYVTPRQVRVAGRVTERGVPLAGVSVRWSDRRGRGEVVNTGPSGDYELVVTKTGPTTFEVAGVPFVEVVPDVSFHELDFDLPSSSNR